MVRDGQDHPGQEPDRPARLAGADPGRPGPEQAAPQPRAGRHAGHPRADRQGQAPARHRAGREQRVAGDEAERTPRQSGRADQPQAARARHRLRPRQDVGQGPQGCQGAHAATPSRATSRAGRCRSIGGCPSAASRTRPGSSMPRSISAACRRRSRPAGSTPAKTVDAEALIGCRPGAPGAGGHPAARSWASQRGRDDRGRRRGQGCGRRGRAGGRQGRGAGRPGRSLMPAARRRRDGWRR